MSLPPGFFDDAAEQARTEQVVETQKPSQPANRDDAEQRIADSTPSRMQEEEETSEQVSTEQEGEPNMTNEMKEFLAFAATVPDDALETEAPAAAGATTSPPTIHKKQEWAQRGSAKAADSRNEDQVVDEESRAPNNGDEQQGPQSEETNVIQKSHNTEGEKGDEDEEEEEDIALLRMIRVAQRAARTEGKRQPPNRDANPVLESILSAKKARLETEEEQGGLLESTPWD